MTRSENKSRRLAALRASVLLLFLPAHVAFVLLIDLNFIPDGAPAAASAIQRDEDPEPEKVRLRLHLLKPSDARTAPVEVKCSLVVCDLDPWELPSHLRPVLPAGESVAATLTKPASIRIWLAATPPNHRAPPA
jgi:hypothetical protein